MSNAYFRFKQFRVDFATGVFRIGTDACFLGAYAHAPTAPRRILDVGTGTGVIALMLAQRFPKAVLTGIDLTKAAIACARQNFRQSPWSDRLRAEKTGVQTYCPTERFDWVVSNPPFFSNAFPAPEAQRHLARHNDRLSVADFLGNTVRLLRQNGRCWLILPTDRLAVWKEQARRYGLYLQSCVYLSDRPEKPSKRVVLCLSFTSATPEVSHWTLKKETGKYTEATTRLWQDFYLYL